MVAVDGFGAVPGDPEWLPSRDRGVHVVGLVDFNQGSLGPLSFTGTLVEAFGDVVGVVRGRCGRLGQFQRVQLGVLTQELVPSLMSNLLNPDAIFSNNEMSLSDIEIYGFDYDYTLVFYSKHLHTLIFNAARDLLINEHRIPNAEMAVGKNGLFSCRRGRDTGASPWPPCCRHALGHGIFCDVDVASEYPAEIRKYEYDPSFAIRGLHYDVHRAVLMKIDAFHYIQLGTVYRGLSVVPDEEVIEMYEGSHVPLEQMSDFYGKSSHGNTMKQFMDIFSLPEMTLLSCVNEHFLRNNIDYEPVHLYKDVKDSIRDVHTKGIMYRAIEADIEKYICYAEQTRAVLAKLADHGKKMFLVTNSPSSFVDKGMRYIVGKDWRDLFDVVIVQAEKPNFFNDKRRPFRKVNEKGVLLWDRIHKLQKGQIYKQGNLYEFLKLTGWRGSKVLYFGDHIYSDLADLTLKHGWRTGAIIPELRSELKIMNTEQYVQTMAWLQTLTGLLEQMQVHRDPESQLVLQEWKKERKEVREMTKNFFNAQFGSLFRTDQNPTYFLRRLSRFADVYMASLSCLLHYDVRIPFLHVASSLGDPSHPCDSALCFPTSVGFNSVSNHFANDTLVRVWSQAP
ncbi:5'-nucleotidase domain-containing protein 3 [Fukomys damarensis]|uniref:5'-nucleotidase domain-containing protein 3 n=1 Tax=Fukomys damarensis TaxID=885580 RepID=A0A091DJ43_FUKDA|nr:5'-nucleotidase domain-containing protein 3 [Fukomys damarensis]